MFDIGFTELMVIALVGLIVIGPERLPKVARTVGHLLGRLQRYVGDVKSDISREMQLEDLKKLQEQVKAQAGELEQDLSEQMKTVEASLNRSILDSAAQNNPSEAPALAPPAEAVPPALASSTENKPAA